MRICTLFVLVCLSFSPVLYAQRSSADVLSEISSWQQHLNKEYKERATSPLSSEDLIRFKEHDFFPADTSYAIEATLVLNKEQTEIAFKTSNERISVQRKYGELHFLLRGKECSLTVYQSPDLMKVPGYEDYLFLPFTDPTNGEETYGGGRYIDLRIPTGNKISVDFNRAYNPYCAYSTKFSCPKVPEENDLKIKVFAGIMKAKKPVTH